jgi:hypothetical protein
MNIIPDINNNKLSITTFLIYLSLGSSSKRRILILSTTTFLYIIGTPKYANIINIKMQAKSQQFNNGEEAFQYTLDRNH